MSVTTITRRVPARGRVVALLAAGSIAVTACGSDEAATGSTIDDVSSTDEVDLQAIREELDALEYESETVGGVAVLGNQPLVVDEAAAAADPTVDPDQGEVAVDVEPCPEEGLCDDEPDVVDGPPTTASPPFAPNTEWAPFCTVLAELEEREFPTDDVEALGTIDVWFRLLEPWVPAIIADDFAVLDDAVDAAVAAHDPSILLGDEEEIERAADRVGTGVDAGCSGRGDLSDLEQ